MQPGAVRVDSLADVVVAHGDAIAARAGAALGVPRLAVLVRLLAHVAHVVSTGRDTLVGVAAGTGLAVSRLHQAAHLVGLAVLPEAVVRQTGTPSADWTATLGGHLRRQGVAVLWTRLGRHRGTRDGRTVALVTGAFLVGLGHPADGDVGEAFEGRRAHAAAPDSAARQARRAAYTLATATAPIHDLLVQALDSVVVLVVCRAALLVVCYDGGNRRAPLLRVALVIRRARQRRIVVVFTVKRRRRTVTVRDRRNKHRRRDEKGEHDASRRQLRSGAAAAQLCRQPREAHVC